MQQKVPRKGSTITYSCRLLVGFMKLCLGPLCEPDTCAMVLGTIHNMSFSHSDTFTNPKLIYFIIIFFNCQKSCKGQVFFILSFNSFICGHMGTEAYPTYHQP